MVKSKDYQKRDYQMLCHNIYKKLKKKICHISDQLLIISSDTAGNQSEGLKGGGGEGEGPEEMEKRERFSCPPSMNRQHISVEHSIL